MEEKPKRWRVRFSLRIMLLGVALLCWLTYQLDWISKRNKALAEPTVYSTLRGNYPPKQEPPRAPGTLWLFGVSGCERISIPAREWSDERAAELRRLFPEAEVGSYRSMARYDEESGRFIWDNWDLKRQ